MKAKKKMMTTEFGGDPKNRTLTSFTLEDIGSEINLCLTDYLRKPYEKKDWKGQAT